MRPKMALKDEGSLIITKGMRAVTGLAATGNNTTSLSEVVCVPLKPANIIPKLRRLSGWYRSRRNLGK